MDPGTFLTELKRRKVYRVAVAYAIVAWLLIQAASILFPTFEAPAWVMKVFVTAVILGSPVALILAWAFELTPEGTRHKAQTDIARCVIEGAAVEAFYALTCAHIGETDKAITQIERLLSTPFGVDYADESITLSDLRQRWEWDPLRNDPRFQKILAAPEPKTFYK